MNEKKYEKIIEIIIKNEKFKFSDLIRLFKPNIDTAPKVGIDKRNEILAESYLLNFNALATVITITDLLTPGINDKICKKPIIRADLKVKFALIFFLKLDLSLK